MFHPSEFGRRVVQPGLPPFKRARLAGGVDSVSLSMLPPGETPVTALETARESRLADIYSEEKKGYVPSGDRVYFNVSVTGQSSSGGPAAAGTISQQPTYAVSDQTYQQPLLEKSDEWTLSVIRFKVPTAYIPLFYYTPNNFLVSIAVQSGSPAFSTNNGVFQQPVVLTSVSDPTQPTAVYFIQDFIDAVNSAITLAYNAARTAGFGGSPGMAPYVSYNPQTFLLTISYEQTWWSPDGVGGANNNALGLLCMTSNLYESYFDSFQALYNSPPYPAGLDVILRLENRTAPPQAAGPQIVVQSGGLTSVGTVATWSNSPVQHGLSVNGAGVNNVVAISGATQTQYNGVFQVASTPTPYSFTYNMAGAPGVSPATGTPTMVALPRGSQIPGQFNSVTQETPSIATWDSFVSLRFITSSVPVRPEWLPAVANSGLGTSSLGTRQVLTDFAPTFSDQIDTRNYIQYFPQGEYRRIDLISAEPLRRFDVQLLWVDRQGVEHRIQIPDNETLDIKFLFERKRIANKSGL